MRHELKTWPDFFIKILTGVKTCEWRKYDRNFLAGDTLTLKEYDPKEEAYLGREIEAVVTDVIRHKDGVGVPRGYCIMSIKVLRVDYL